MRYFRSVKRGLPNKGSNPYGDEVDARSAFDRQVQLDEIKSPEAPLIGKKDHGVVVVARSDNWEDAKEKAIALLDAKDDRIARTSGPMGCVVVDTNHIDAGGWFFFGNVRER